jgi:hypothetical protein
VTASKGSYYRSHDRRLDLERERVLEFAWPKDVDPENATAARPISQVDLSKLLLIDNGSNDVPAFSRLSRNTVAKIGSPELRDEYLSAAGKSATKSDVDEAANAESQAALKLKLAIMLLQNGVLDKAKERLGQISEGYPDTNAAKEAEELLRTLEK